MASPTINSFSFNITYYYYSNNSNISSLLNCNTNKSGYLYDTTISTVTVTESGIVVVGKGMIVTA